MTRMITAVRSGISLSFTFFVFFLYLVSCKPQPQQGSRIEPTPKNLEFNAGVISQIIVVPPVLKCGVSVTVRSFIPGAHIRIFQDGVLIGQGTGFDPQEQTFPVNPALEKDKLITATQEFEGKQSDPSAAEKVKDHTEVYPTGLPKPEFPFLYLYNCGIATYNDHLPPGGELRVFSRDPAAGGASSLVGNVIGVAEGQTVAIGPAFITGRFISAESQICSDISPRAEEQTVQTAPASLPQAEVTGIYENGKIITIHQLVDGAKVTIKRAGVVIGGGGAPGPHVRFGLSVEVHNGESLEIVQELCGVESPPAVITVQPCSALPPAIMMAPRAGDQVIYLTDVVAGSRIRIFASGQEIGDGGGTSVVLTRPLVDGETIICVQSIGNCVSSSVHALEVGHGLDDPLNQGTCTVNQFEYGNVGDPGRVTTDVSSYFNSPSFCVSTPMNAVPLHGVVRYPSGPGPFPIVVIVHGNHDAAEPSYPGYNYLLDLLASHCIIAVSVEEDFLNGCKTPGGGFANVSGDMDARAIVLLRHLQLWREWNRTPGNRFYGKVDMGKIGLAGHSRGGEAIVAAQVYNHSLHNPADPQHNFNFGIQALYAIAPVDGQFEGTPITLKGADYYVMHGSHDGDVSDFDGHQMFDRAYPVNEATNNFKGLLWIYGADHGQWNSVWGSGSESAVSPAAQLISEPNQMLIGKSYMTAFYLASLKGWSSYRYFLSGDVTFPSLPGAITRVFEYQDSKKIFLNHYEEDNDPATGSFPGVVNNKTGTFEKYEMQFFTLSGPPYFFVGETHGLLTGWKNTENAEIHIVIPDAIRQSIKDYEFLAFDIGQNHEAVSALNTPGVNKDLSVQLNLGGAAGPQLKVSDYGTLPYPIVTSSGTKTVKQTIRIPWKDLIGKPGKNQNITEIVIKFNRQTSGLVSIDEMQLTN